MVEVMDKLTFTPQALYDAYPDSDLLGIAPEPGEDWRTFTHRADSGDALFLFLCREADGGYISDAEYRQRLLTAMQDIRAVMERL